MYDLIVLGGGPAGYVGAERAAQGGLKVLLLEKRNVGGVCLNEGCIPSKTFLHSAKIVNQAKKGIDYGVVCRDIAIDHGAVITRKNEVVKFLTEGVAQKLKRLGVVWVKAEGKIVERCDNFYKVEAGGEVYSTRRLLITTGSVATMPPIKGLAEQFENGFIMTSREVFDVEMIPPRLVIVGGGVIGIEMASYFKAAGSEVTIVEVLNAIGGPLDEQVAKVLKQAVEEMGIVVKTGCRVTGFTEGQVTFLEGDFVREIACDKVLIAIGRKPNTERVGLENIGILLKDGAVVTDQKMRTNQPEVYAAGDVNGKSMLAHTAYREAEVAVNQMLGKSDIMTYHAIPSIIYSSPEVAAVGLTEEMAKSEGIDFEVKTLPMRYSGRYEAENKQGTGICKLIIDKKWQKIIGVHLIGNHASELIWGVDVLIQREMNIETIKKIVFPHPTVAEIIREAVFY